MPVGYSADALVYDSIGGSWQLRADYDPAAHRVQFTFVDDDEYLHGDVGADEVGSDNNQSATVKDMNGNTIASGQVYDEEFYAVWDGVNPTIWIERVEIGGAHVGYVVSEPLTAGTKYGESTRSDVDGPPTAPTYSSFANVPCFGRGTRIETDSGERPVEWIAPGDLVLTLDEGFQPVRWVGRYHLPEPVLSSKPHLLPIGIPVDNARRPLLVSPQHRVLVTGGALEMHFGMAEAFCPAKFLGSPWAIRSSGYGYTYFHLLLDRHQILRSDGVWTESLFAAGEAGQIAAATGLHPPDDLVHQSTARPCLKAWEARMLFADATALTSAAQHLPAA